MKNKKKSLSLKRTFFVLLLLSGVNSLCFAQDTVEVDLIDREIKFADFQIGNYKFSGTFLFNLDRDDSSLIANLNGKDISLTPIKGKEQPADAGLSVTVGDKEISIPWVKIDLQKQGDVVFVNRISWPKFLIKGRADLKESKLFLDVDGQWQANGRKLKGPLKAKGKIWGSFYDLLISGQLTMQNGRYKDRELRSLRLDVFGKPPVLNITDSEFILKDGTVATLAGDKFLDLRGLYDFIPGAEFRPQKVFIDNWQLFSEGSSDIGLKKNVSEKIDVSVKSGEKEESSGPKTELRYKLEGNKYLKLKVEDNRSVLGLERRKDF